MRLRNSSTRYGLIAQVLHWAVVGLVCYQYILASRAAEATLFQRLGLLATHKSVGLTVLALAIVRLAWNHGTGRPYPPRGEPAYRVRLAKVSHGLLYGLLLAMPITGWLMSSAANTPVSYFGWFTLPDLIAADPEWLERLETLHGSLFLALAITVAAHMCAAVYHEVVLKDDVLRRMLPWPERRR